MSVENLDQKKHRGMKREHPFVIKVSRLCPTIHTTKAGESGVLAENTSTHKVVAGFVK